VTQRDARRRIPQVDRLVDALEPDAALPRPVVVDAVRTVVDAVRRRARRTDAVPDAAEVEAMCRDELKRRRRRLLGRVVNATGVIVHTNLGRAPLSPEALDAVVAVASGYSNLEWDADLGSRGDRYVHVEPLLAVATGAEAALVVNNNAAAVLLVCAALASGREVVVSRGELIEIGGGFRIPEVLAQSGATLREVGTTNRTHLRDYERAIGQDTALVLAVHPSNYRVVGFTTRPPTSDLAALCRKAKVPLAYDVGSGLLGRDLADEPAVGRALDDGADLVCFSGDKLLGGPQAGIIVGRKRLVDPLRSHPLLRAIRPDKMQLAALGATVSSYLSGDAAALPVWQMIDAEPAALRRRARKLAKAAIALGYEAEITDGESVVGGGSLPGQTIPTPLVLIRDPDRSAKAVAAALRDAPEPVVVRVERGAVAIDLRTVAPSDDHAVLGALER